MSLLELENVYTSYGESSVLRGIDLTVEPGEIVALLGRNGAGKTTTLRTILQLTPPHEGSVRFKNEDVTGMSTYEVARRGIGWVPEERRMFAHLSVEENIRVAIKDQSDIEAEKQRAFEVFPKLEEFRDREAGTLSGGEQQMVAIARGLVGANDLLLIDEPSEGLAPMIIDRVAEALEEIAAETTVLLVEQNFPLAVSLAERFYIIDQGQCVDSGGTENLTEDDERVTRYLSA